MASSQRSTSKTVMTRTDKVRSIFDRFDANGDGGLSRDEMGALVTAVKPNVKFSSDQISTILDEVFRSYSNFIENPLIGLSFNGLLRIYDDGTGDVDRDYSALFSSSPVISTTQLNDAPKIPNLSVAAACSKSPTHGVLYVNTRKLVEDLEIAIIRGIKGCTRGHFNVKLDYRNFVWDKNCADFRKLLKEVREIRVAIDRNFPREEVTFDGHMAIGRTLQRYNLLTEALQSFQRAADLRPTDVWPQYEVGNCLSNLGRLDEAKVRHILCLELAETNSNKWLWLLPCLHVNLGYVLKEEGMLFSASEQYREAAILSPKDSKGLMLSGFALYEVGEYRAAEKALEEAVFRNPEDSEAHYILGLVFRAVGEDERTILEFQRAIDLNPNHLDALYNLGCLFQEMGRYHRAAELYGRVGFPANFWQAQANQVVSLYRAGEIVDATKVSKELRKGLHKMTDAAEVYSAMRYMVDANDHQLQKNHGGLLSSTLAKFKRACEKTIRRECLADALIRHNKEFQRNSKLHLCDVSLLSKEICGSKEERKAENSTSKAALEVILRKWLHFLKSRVFQLAVKEINQKILSVLDSTASGRVELGMFYAVIAPTCAGEPNNCKRAAFDALLWHSRRKKGQNVIEKVYALKYVRYLRLIYLPSQGYSTTDLLIGHVEEENTMISFPEFLLILDDDRRGCGFNWHLLQNIG
ncbi:uncharacterized TPR repeat-containing protein At2g32450-like [Macadamia integrifolia]|uniref:uncharacterized TPR repeat-containing protein At2g32450-like n=1 Tax=Macadamia integrifolia TaxID=60698 RepID=UPI001C4E4403|nr:uncharacterized TPR repeat-containing protein At2g32450-like [Macadamia integrifolia]